MFYYLLAGASPEDKEELHLTKPEEYHYLNQVSTVSRFMTQIFLFPCPMVTTCTVFIRLNATAFIKFLMIKSAPFIRGQCFYEGGFYLKSNLFLANN